MATETAQARHEWFVREVEGLLPELYGAALHFAKNRADAEDLVADAVAKAWLKLDDLRDAATFRGWLFTILSNTYRSCARKDATRGVEESLDAEAESGASFSLFERLHQPFLLWWGNPEQEFLQRLLRDDLERAVDALPQAFRMVVVLADLQGLPYQTIADSLDLPIGTVRSRLARGRALLQRALWAHAVDAGLATPRPERKTAT